eukprot:3867724-Pleurochrysis_carterae.AAC.1
MSHMPHVSMSSFPQQSSILLTACCPSGTLCHYLALVLCAHRYLLGMKQCVPSPRLSTAPVEKPLQSDAA